MSGSARRCPPARRPRKASLPKIAVVLIAAGLPSLVGAPAGLAASAAPALAIRSLAQPTDFSSADDRRCEATKECDSYSLTVTNTGSEPMSEAPETPLVITDTLPPGLVVRSIEGRDLDRSKAEDEVPCFSSPQLHCEYGKPIPPGDVLQVTIKVSVNSVTPPEPNVTNHAEVRVGGVALAHTEGPLTTSNGVGGEPPSFGIEDFGVDAYGPDGRIDTQAGDHPYALTTSVDFDTIIDPSGYGNREEAYAPVQEPKALSVEFPVGLISALQTAGECPESALFNPTSESACPPDSRVGIAVLDLAGRYVSSQTPQSSSYLTAVYNMVPEHGYSAVFGLGLIGSGAVMYADLIPTAAGYRVRITVPALPRPTLGAEKLDGMSLTFFGDPAEQDGNAGEPDAFFANPTSCPDLLAQLDARIETSSWVNPGAPPVAEEVPVYPEIMGCDMLQFNPAIAVVPETTQADTPSGYEVDLRAPQSPNVFPDLATPDLREATITLPAGVAISPSGAGELVGCTGEAIDLLGVETGVEGVKRAKPGACPAASQIGTVEITTPLVSEKLTGHIYLAQPQCGEQSACTEAQAEAGQMLGLYVEAEGQGVDVKLPGEVEVGGAGAHSREAGLAPGQLRVRFAQAPQLPFSELKLQLDGGARAPLVNPQVCGAAQTESVLEPWSAAPGSEAPEMPSQPFMVTGCVGAFQPSFLAQTGLPIAGGFTPLTVQVSRRDGEQDLGGIEVSSPPGLMAKIAGVPLCGEPQAALGTCPAASGIGTVTMAAGAGSRPLWLSGTVHLTGPYGGAPFGLSMVAPEQAGPLNLGEAVVRAAIHIDPRTAAIRIVSDSLPQSGDGIPFGLQTVELTIDRPGFVFNPTSCGALRIEGKITGERPVGSGEALQSALLASPFAVAGCRRLPFDPSVSASTRGRASVRGDGASLIFKVLQRSGEANIRSVRVSLPKKLPSRLTTLQRACPEALFDANPASCPAASDIGTAVGHTVVLPVALEGPAFFVSHGGARYPELVVVLQGDGVTIDLVGETQIDIRTGITSSTFASVPDVPISAFELRLPERSNSALASPGGNLCGKRLTMPMTITAQNGARIKRSVKVAVSGCPKHRRKAKPVKRAARGGRSTGSPPGRRDRGR
jgi:hypothetical protein